MSILTCFAKKEKKYVHQGIHRVGYPRFLNKTTSYETARAVQSAP
jgi:hypothetical protein